MKIGRIAVVAGTPLDTKLGVKRLEERDIQGIPFNISDSPQEQMIFQISPEDKKYETVLNVLKEARERGCKKAFIYCNSLSGAVDFKKVEQELEMRMITPLLVYENLAKSYKKIGIMSANAVGLAGIEKVMLHKNEDLDILGLGMMPLVQAIENEENPEEIIKKLNMTKLVEWFKHCGAEAVILGCTHFPYIKKELRKKTDLTIIDPTDKMIDMLEE